MIRKLLTACVKAKASDSHLSSGCKAKLRIDGDLADYDPSPILDDSMISKMLIDIMTEDQKTELIETFECDFSIDDADNDSRFRANAFFITEVMVQFSVAWKMKYLHLSNSVLLRYLMVYKLKRVV